MAKEELGRRWVGIDKEDFSELVAGRLKEIESMFSTDLGVVHRLDAPVKTARDDGLPKGSRRGLPPAWRKRGPSEEGAVRVGVGGCLRHSLHCALALLRRICFVSCDARYCARVAVESLSGAVE